MGRHLARRHGQLRLTALRDDRNNGRQSLRGGDEVMRRRAVLKAAVAGAVTAFAATVPGLRALAAPLRVRRSVNKMALDDPDLATYRDFVGLMRSKSPQERVSWVGFANQHGDKDDFKYCPHGDWYFLPWHRGFVEMYETAASVLMKNPKFAMPYWDWTELRDYPKAFSEPKYKGRANPLFTPGEGDNFEPGGPIARNPLGPNVLTNAIVGQTQVIAKIYKETVYERFGTSKNPGQQNLDASWVVDGGGVQGIMESTPHNQIHNDIGGFMPQSNSPRDPIFMMHHGNIDRIWAGWNNLGRANSKNKLWLDMTFKDNYISPDGKFFTKGVKDFLSTSALGYTYDNLPKPLVTKLDLAREGRLLALMGGPPGPGPVEGLKRVKATPSPLAPSEVSLKAVAHLDHNDLVGAMTPTAGRPSEVVALISDMQVPDNVSAVRVFVNRPSVSLDVPETDPHFVTTIAFLHHGGRGGGGHHKAAPSTIVDLTDTLRGLSRSKALSDDNVTVQLLPVPMPGVAAGAIKAVTPRSVEIAFL
jgi:tyrosinase